MNDAAHLYLSYVHGRLPVVGVQALVPCPL